MRHFPLRLLSGLWAELRATAQVWTLLRWPFWMTYAGVFLLPLLIPFLPGALASLAAGVLVLALGLGAIFSGFVGKRVRRWNWVTYPNGPEVVPYLSQALTVLLFPPFFLAMAGLFHALGEYLPGLFPGTQPPPSWPLTLALALDNVLFTQIFFDFFECFHLRAAAKPQGWVAATLIFIVRTLLDVAFIKFTVQVLRAAYFRALDLGRGGDLVAQTKQACEAEDVSATRLHSREVGQSVRAAAEDLRRHYEAGGPEAEQAWLGLRAMKAFALAHFEGRMLTQLGEERDRTEALLHKLREDTGPEPEPQPIPLRGYLVLALLYLVLTGLTYYVWVADARLSWPLAFFLTFLQGWFLIFPRRWLDRLDSWHILPASAPDWFPYRILLWLLLLAPLFVVNASEVVWLVGQRIPSTFGAPTAEDVTPVAAAEFVIENLLRVQIFADTVEIYNLRIFNLVQQGLLGGILTFLLRLVLNLGLLAVLVPFFLERFNRWFRGIQTRPDAELLLRREARACGPHSAMLVAYYFRQVRDWFVEEMNRQQENPTLLAALATSGFGGDFQTRYPQSQRPSEDPTVDINRRLERAQVLIRESMLGEAEQEARRAVELLETLRDQGRGELDDLIAYSRFVQGELAINREHLHDAEVHLRESYALIQKMGADQVGSPYTNRVAQIQLFLAEVIGRVVTRAPEALEHCDHSIRLFQHLVNQGESDYREALSSALGVRGQILNLLQRWDESVQSLQQSIQLLETIQRESEQEFSGQGFFAVPQAKRLDVRDSLSKAHLQLATVYRELRRFDEAASEARLAIPGLEALLREGDASQRDLLARAYNLLGLSLIDSHKPDEAKVAFEQSRLLCEQLILEGQENLRILLAPVLNNLGLLLLPQGQPQEAEKHFRRAIELTRASVGAGLKQLEEILVNAYANLGYALQEQHRMHEAEEELQRAIDLGRQLVHAGQTNLRDELAQVLIQQGKLLTLRFEWRRAAEALKESAHWFHLVVASGAEQYRPLMAEALAELSRSLRAYGELDEAETQGLAAVEQYQLLRRQDAQRYRYPLAQTLRTLGLAYQANRHFEEALARFQESGKLIESASPEDRTLRSWLLADISRTQEAQQRQPEALELLDQAIQLQVQLVREGRTGLQGDLGLLFSHRGDLQNAQGHQQAAWGAYREAVDRLKVAVEAGRKDLREYLAVAHLNTGVMAQQLGESTWPDSFRAGLALYAELVRQGAPGPTEGYHVQAERFAAVLFQQQRFSEAVALLREAVATYAAVTDPLNHRARLGEASARFHLARLLMRIDSHHPEAVTESAACLSQLEGLLTLPEPPDQALRQYREQARTLIEELPNEPGTALALRALAFLQHELQASRPGVTGARIELFEMLAMVQEVNGQPEEALLSLQQAEELSDPDPLEFYSTQSPSWKRFRIYRSTQRLDEARQLAESAVRDLTAATAEESWTNLPQSTRGLLLTWRIQLGSLYLIQGDVSAASEQFRELVERTFQTESSLRQRAGALTYWLRADTSPDVLETTDAFLRSLPEPETVDADTQQAVVGLLDQVLQVRPDEATWQALRQRWSPPSPEA